MAQRKKSLPKKAMVMKSIDNIKFNYNGCPSSTVSFSISSTGIASPQEEQQPLLSVIEALLL